MPRVISACLLGCLALITLAAAYAKAPYLRLRADVAAGRLDFAGLMISDFMPVPFSTPTLPLRVGSASLSVPAALVPGDGEDGFSFLADDVLRLAIGGVTLITWAPASENAVQYRHILDPEFAASCGGLDVVALIAGAYAADVREVSLHMTSAEAHRLRQMLKLREALLRYVDRVEVLRSQSVKGVLLIKKRQDDSIAMVLEYYSPDESLHGTMMLVVEPGSENLRLAQAIISSFQLEPAAPSAGTPTHSGNPAGQGSVAFAAVRRCQ
jgi:hypothetical protein